MKTENNLTSRILDINKLGAIGTAIRILLPTDEENHTAELRYNRTSEMDARENARKVVRMLNNYENLLSALKIASEYVAHCKLTMEGEVHKDYEMLLEAIKEAEGE